MQKLFKSKMVKLALVTLMLMSMVATMMVGCGGNSGNESGKESEQSASANTNTAGEKVVKVGIIGPFTGPAARTGEEFKNSINMAFEEVDYKVGDYKIEFVWVDSESDAEKAARAYEQAIVKDKIDVGFMDWHSWVSVSCMDIAAKYKMPHFFAFGAGDTVNEKIKGDYEKYKYWVGKAWPTSSLLTNAYVETINQAIESGKWSPRNKKFAIYGVDNDWGRNFGNALSKQFQDTGWELTSEAWVAIGETDFYPMISKLKKEDVSLIAGTMSDPSSIAAFIKQTREVGLQSLIISDGLGWVGEWYNLCGEASDYVLDQIPQWTTPEAKKFFEDFTAEYGFEPGPSAAGMCYDWTRFFIKVMNHTLETYGDLSTESFRKVADEYVIPGKLTYTDGIIHKEYKFTPESFPDPVVDQEHYIFPVIQYFEGQGKMVWPDAWKDQDIAIPDFAK
jgi:branched-chain amino acid transport system substrate-binding protein